MDPHAQPDCPICAHYNLLVSKDATPLYFCSNCGWVLPSPWVLFRLLRQARNWVQDPVLREKIQRIAPPEPRNANPTTVTPTTWELHHDQ